MIPCEGWEQTLQKYEDLDIEKKRSQEKTLKKENFLHGTMVLKCTLSHIALGHMARQEQQQDPAGPLQLTWTHHPLTPHLRVLTSECVWSIMRARCPRYERTYPSMGKLQTKDILQWHSELPKEKCCGCFAFFNGGGWYYSMITHWRHVLSHGYYWLLGLGHDIAMEAQKQWRPWLWCKRWERERVKQESTIMIDTGTQWLDWYEKWYMAQVHVSFYRYKYVTHGKTFDIIAYVTLQISRYLWPLKEVVHT